jgi:neutral trehalase
MYDNIAFDKQKNLMLLADVGLMSLYIVDCNALADIAIELGKPTLADELRLRADKYSANLQKLWNEEQGIFLNKRLDNNIFSGKLSPTLFYPLFAGVATQKQAERMINEHFYNPDEFWGEYIMPSIARNDSTFADNHYFRGRIWPPMNFIVYLGLRKYRIGNSCNDMVEISKEMLLKTWHLKGDVYENYNATTGEGFDMGSSQKSYYWGALFGFMSFIENGQVEAPENSIKTNKLKN